MNVKRKRRSREMKMNQQKSSEAAVMTSVVLKGSGEQQKVVTPQNESWQSDVWECQGYTNMHNRHTNTRRVVLVKTSDSKAFMWSFKLFFSFCHQKQSVSRSCFRRNNESLSPTFLFMTIHSKGTIMHFMHIIQLFGKCYKSFSAFMSAIIEVTWLPSCELNQNKTKTTVLKRDPQLKVSLLRG